MVNNGTRMLIALILGLGVILVGCVESPITPEKDGTLVLSFVKDSFFLAKTIEPDIDMSIDTYEVVGQGPGDTTFTQTLSGQNLFEASVIPGSWIITVNGYNSNDSLLASGEATVNVNAGEVATSEITVSPLDGAGTLDLTVVWPDSVLKHPAVSGKYTPVSGSAQTMNFTLNTAENTNPDSAEYTGTLSSGYYTTTVQLTDNGQVVWGITEAARILKNQVSSRGFTLTNDVNRGGIRLAINDSLANPFDITIDGLISPLSKGSSMTVEGECRVGHICCFLSMVSPGKSHRCFSWRNKSIFRDRRCTETRSLLDKRGGDKYG